MISEKKCDTINIVMCCCCGLYAVLFIIFFIIFSSRPSVNKRHFYLNWVDYEFSLPSTKYAVLILFLSKKKKRHQLMASKWFTYLVYNRSMLHRSFVFSSSISNAISITWHKTIKSKTWRHCDDLYVNLLCKNSKHKKKIVYMRPWTNNQYQAVCWRFPFRLSFIPYLFILSEWSSLISWMGTAHYEMMCTNWLYIVVRWYVETHFLPVTDEKKPNPLWMRVFEDASLYI